MGSPNKTQSGCEQSASPWHCRQGLCLKGSAFPCCRAGGGWGHYLTGSPRLFVRPVLVVADVPPLDLQGVGGGAAAAEGTRHLHILTRLRRHVVGGLREESCWRQSQGCGCLRGHSTVPLKDNASGHTESPECLDPSLANQTQLLRQSRQVSAVPKFSFPTPMSPSYPQQSCLAPPWHFAKSSGGKGRGPLLPQHPSDLCCRTSVGPATPPR